MKRRKKTRYGHGGGNAVALAVAVAATAAALLFFTGKLNAPLKQIRTVVSNYSSSAVEAQTASAASGTSAPKNEDLCVSFIDVGQGDGILLSRGGHGMLIDAGTEDSAKTVVNYIKSKKLSALDYCVGTHPHEDHIGGMDSVIKSFKIGTFIMPDVIANTKSFSDVLLSAKQKRLLITRPVPGRSYGFEGATFTVLAPNSIKYDDLNDYSVVIRLVYGSTSFLFTGDAQAASEREMLAKGYNLKADVLKVGHHGSSTSTTSAFLKAVGPKYAVISVGKGNVYGLPSKSTVSRLTSAGVNLFRTDRDGTVVAIDDGKTLRFKTKAAA